MSELPNGGRLQQRISDVERRVNELEHLELQRTQEQVKNLHQDLGELVEEMRTTTETFDHRVTRLTNVGIAIVVGLLGTFVTALLNFIDRISTGGG